MKNLRKWLWRLLLLGVVFSAVWYSISLRGELFSDRAYAKALYDREGKLMSASISSEEQWYFESSGLLSDKYKKALITFEDKRFFSHLGFDVRALLRAVRLNIRAGRIVSGGSTISMQTIRLNQNNPPRTILQKIQEIILATRLEIKHTKEEILQLYASHAPFGGNVIGIDAACWRYFNKSPANISWAEASLLAVLPNSPGLIHTERNREKLRAKRNRLLKRLVENQEITETQYQGALLEEIPRRAKRLPQEAPHFLHYANRKSGKSIVRSTIDRDLQQKCNAIAESQSRNLKANFIDNIAIIVLDIETQEVLAYVGNLQNTGRDNQEFTDMVQAQRSTGSVLKPFLFTAALDDGLITEKSFLPDYPLSMNGFITKNYTDEHTGLINANIALQKSLNVPFAKLLQQYKVEKFRLLCQDLGLRGINKSSDYYGIPLILGGAESSLWDLTHAYASMGKILNTYNKNDGFYEKQPVYSSNLLITSKDNSETKLVADPALFKAENIWLTFNNLKEVNRPSSEGEWKQFSTGVPIAWKTGTSNGFKDAWAIGVNAKYAIGVWVGNSDGEGRPGIVGLKAAAPIFFRVVHSLRNHKEFEMPIDDMTKIEICKLSGELNNGHCPVDSLYISANSKYLTPCSYHEQILTDINNTYRVFPSCYPGETANHIQFTLSPHVAYYYKQKNLYGTNPPLHPDCQANNQSSIIEILYPEPNIKIYQPRIGNEERNQMILKAHHIDADAELHWHMDSNYLGSTQKIHELSVLLNTGKHQLLVMDQNGNQDVTNFEILQ